MKHFICTLLLCSTAFAGCRQLSDSVAQTLHPRTATPGPQPDSEPPPVTTVQEYTSHTSSSTSTSSTIVVTTTTTSRQDTIVPPRGPLQADTVIQFNAADTLPSFHRE